MILPPPPQTQAHISRAIDEGRAIPASLGPAESLEWAIQSQRKVLRLTPAWKPFEPHAVQSAFAWHPARFKINPSGRRSGKTEIVKRKAVLRLLKRSVMTQKILLGAPTLGQAREIFWEDLKALVPSWWVAKISETRMEIQTRWGAMLRVFGFDRPQRMEGTPWTYVGIDEIADCPRNCFSLNIRPALSTRALLLSDPPGCDLTGVPDETGKNQAEYEELYHLGLKWPADPDVCSFHWSSADILPAKEIESARRTMDQLAFEQEYLGRYVSSGGKALPRFDVKFHANNPQFCGYSPFLPLDWSLDFGAGLNSASLLGQTYRNHVWIIDEINMRDGSTEAQAEALLPRLAELRIPRPSVLRVFGDAAGHGTSQVIGRSDYDILEERLANMRMPTEWFELQAAPLIKDTLNSVRGRLASMDNHVHLHIHPRCEGLIKDCRSAPWPDPGKLREFHYLAALRYYCFGLGERTVYESAPLALPNLGGRTKSPN